MKVRKVKRTDIPQISILYYNTVRNINAKDYRADKIQAWAPKLYADKYWLQRFKNYRVFVVEAENQVVGFSELGKYGHVDCFYVDYCWQGRGVGRLLMQRLNAEARKSRITKLYSEVSVTALVFLNARDFVLNVKFEKFIIIAVSFSLKWKNFFSYA
ncbi:N-acetyltransferase family protein [Kaarinaea lacus]